jgi:hypothetical protein
MKIRLAIIVPTLIIAVLFYAGLNTSPLYKLYGALLIISYPIIIQSILNLLPKRGTLRDIIIGFIIISPPFWAAEGISFLFSNSQAFASSDVLLPFLWILFTLTFFAFLIAIFVLEKFQNRD